MSALLSALWLLAASRLVRTQRRTARSAPASDDSLEAAIERLVTPDPKRPERGAPLVGAGCALALTIAGGFGAFDSPSRSWPSTAAQVLVALLIVLALERGALPPDISANGKTGAWLLGTFTIVSLLFCCIAAAQDQPLDSVFSGMSIGTISGIGIVVVAGFEDRMHRLTRTEVERRLRESPRMPER